MRTTERRLSKNLFACVLYLRKSIDCLPYPLFDAGTIITQQLRQGTNGVYDYSSLFFTLFSLCLHNAALRGSLSVSICLSASIANSIYNDLISHLNDGKQKQQPSRPGLPNTYRTVFFSFQTGPGWLGWARQGILGIHNPGFLSVGVGVGVGVYSSWPLCFSLLLFLPTLGFSTTIILGT